METPGLGEEGKRGARRKRNFRLKAPPQTSVSPFHLVRSVLGTQGPGLETVISWEGKAGLVLPFPHSAHHCLLLPCTLMRGPVLALFLHPS